MEHKFSVALPEAALTYNRDRQSPQGQAQEKWKGKVECKLRVIKKQTRQTS